MPAPKTETIRRHCTNSLAVEILHERGILSDMEAESLRLRSIRSSDRAYARIYDTSARYYFGKVLEDAGAPVEVVEAAQAAVTERLS